MKKILLFMGVMACTLLAFPTMAQHVCGLRGADAAMVKQALLEHREEMRDFVRQRGAITYVPVKIHLVANNEGLNRIPERAGLNMLCALNEFYLTHEIQFYLKDGFNYIDHTPLLGNPTSTVSRNKMSAEKVNYGINIFAVSSIGGGGGGTTLAYYQPPIGSRDWIVIDASYASDVNVLPHEVGHFFDLSHPFYGWEDNAWNAGDHGTQVGNFAPNVTQGQVQNDRMDQTDCLTAADGICDTPPDYLFGFHQQQNDCDPWTIEVRDFNGDVVDPQENNLMSYFGDCATYELTSDQVDAVYNSLGSTGRNYVNPGDTPILDEITEETILTYPPDASTVSNASVLLQWDVTPGATHYLLEVDRFNSFSFTPDFYILTNTGKTLTDLVVNSTYYWRVRPFTEYRSCSDFSEIFTFETADIPVSTTNIDVVESWLVRPNPVQKNSKLVIEMNSSESFDARVKVFSLTGQLMNSTKHVFNEGASTYEVSTSDLSTGMYIVSVQTAKGVMTKKVVVR